MSVNDSENRPAKRYELDRRRTVRIEIACLAVGALVLIGAAVKYEWFERIEQFARAHGASELDEFILVAGALAVGLSVFSFRRWREAELEVAQRRTAEAALRDLQNELEARVGQRTAELTRLNDVLRAEIEERKLAELALDEVRERYRAVFEGSRDCLYLLDFEGRILDANPATMTASGYTLEELRKHRMIDFLQPEQRALAVSRVRQVRATGKQSAVEVFRFRRKDGQLVHIETCLSLVLRGGVPYALQGLARDVTDRERAEAALRNSEERLQMATSVAEVGTFEHDLVTGASYASPLLRKMLQLDDPAANAFIAFTERIYSEDRAAFQATVARSHDVTGDGNFDLELRVQLPDGTRRWLRVQSKTWFSGEGAARRPLRAIGAVSDVTDRRSSLQRQRLQYDVTLALAEAGTSGHIKQQILETLVGALEGDCGELWVVDRAQAVLRLEVSWPAVAGTASGFDRSRRKMAVEGSLPHRVWKAAQPEWTCEIAGELRWTSTEAEDVCRSHNQVGFPIKLHDEVLGVITISTSRGRDWDERMLAVLDTVGVQFAQFLERQRLAEQFRQAQKMEAIGTLAGGIAHDFNNIIAGISGYAELAKMELGENHPVNEYLDAVVKGAARGGGLVRQILAFTRQQEHDRKPTQLADVVDEALSLLRATIPRTVDFDVQIARDLPHVLADAVQIHQVVMNLCTNAWHAMGDRPGKLGVALEACEVDEHIASNHAGLRVGSYVRLSISDTGHGMDEATLGRIFEPFFTTKEPGQGTGLGLAVVHGVMESHGGTVTVYSQPGEGTIFRLYLPPCGNGAEHTLPETVGVPQGRGQRVLFVDDDAALAAMGKKVLERVGYAVDYRTDPGEALELLKVSGERYDLLVTDLAMPTMPGTDLAQQARSIMPRLPIILVTGFAGNLTLSQVRALGVSEMLLKPLSLSALTMAVQRTLREANLR